jgi:hypothetical protein
VRECPLPCSNLCFLQSAARPKDFLLLIFSSFNFDSLSSQSDRHGFLAPRSPRQVQIFESQSAVFSLCFLQGRRPCFRRSGRLSRLRFHSHSGIFVRFLQARVTRTDLLSTRQGFDFCSGLIRQLVPVIFSTTQAFSPLLIVDRSALRFDAPKASARYFHSAPRYCARDLFPVSKGHRATFIFCLLVFSSLV